VTDILRELNDSAARTLGTTPEALDDAWGRAELRMAQRVLESRGLDLQLDVTRTERAVALVDDQPIRLPDPRHGALSSSPRESKASPLVTGAPGGAGTGPSVVPAWDVGRPTYPRQSFGNWNEHGYRANEIAFACVRELAQSSAEPRLRVRLSDDEDAPWENDHPARLFVKRPNPQTTESGFLAQLITLATVGGMALAWKERAGGGRVVALRWLRSDRVKQVRNADGTIRHWTYNNGTSEVDLPAEDVVPFPYAFDPLNPTWGLSPFAVLARAIAVDNTTTDFQAKFFEQAGVPYGLITTEQMLMDDDAERIAERWQERYAGMEGWHKPAVLGQGAKYERMGLNMAEMQLDFLRAHSEARICGAFGVPPIIVGAKVGLDRSTFANYAEARKSFWQETLRPLYQQIADVFTLWLAPDFGSQVHFAFDLSNVGALQIDEGEKWTRAREAFTAGFVSDNEARQEIGLDPWPVARRVLTVAMIPEDAPVADERNAKSSSRGRERKARIVPLDTKAQGSDELRRTMDRSQRSLVPPFETRMRKLYRGIADHAAAAVRASKARPVSELLSDDDRDELELELRRFRDLVGEQTVELLNGLYPLGATYQPDASYYAKVDRDTAAMWETLQTRVAELLTYAEEQSWSDDELVNGDDSHAGIVGAIAGSTGDDRPGVHVLTATTSLIALDQYVGARNDASVLAYRAGGVASVEVEDGIDHDEACIAADGQRWTLEEAMLNDKEHPNCVRVFVPVFDEES
jgi:HK97 family phage portal protein